MIVRGVALTVCLAVFCFGLVGCAPPANSSPMSGPDAGSISVSPAVTSTSADAPSVDMELATQPGASAQADAPAQADTPTQPDAPAQADAPGEAAPATE